MRIAGRIAAAIAGLVTLAAGSWSVLFSAIGWGTAWERPDPAVPDGDPCCGHPDDWGDVAEAVVGGLVMTGIGMVLCVAAVALARWAFFEDRLRARWFAIAPAAVVIPLALVCAIAIAGNR